MLQDLFEIAAPRLRPPLFTDAAVQRLRRALPLAGRSPGLFLLECRLAADDPQVDLGIGLYRGHGFHEDLPPCDDPGFDLLKRFSEQVGRGSLRAVEHVGLEYDLPDDRPAHPVPGVFYRLPTPLFLTDTPREDLDEAVRDGLRLLMGGEPPLQRFLDARPPGTWVVAPAHFPGRTPVAARVVVWYETPAAAREHLRRLDLPTGELDEAEATGARVVLGYDLAAEGLAMRGAELYFGWDPEGRRRALDFADALVRQGLCCPEKRRALEEEWHASDREEGPWPTALSGLQRGSTAAVIYRVAHFKLSWSPTPAAKVYLKIQHVLVA